MTIESSRGLMTGSARADDIAISDRGFLADESRAARHARLRQLGALFTEGTPILHANPANDAATRASKSSPSPVRSRTSTKLAIPRLRCDQVQYGAAWAEDPPSGLGT